MRPMAAPAAAPTAAPPPDRYEPPLVTRVERMAGGVDTERRVQLPKPLRLGVRLCASARSGCDVHPAKTRPMRAATRAMRMRRPPHHPSENSPWTLAPETHGRKCVLCRDWDAALAGVAGPTGHRIHPASFTPVQTTASKLTHQPVGLPPSRSICFSASSILSA